MSEQNAPAPEVKPTPEAKAPEAPVAPPAPAIDVEAITKNAVDQAQKAADVKLKKIAKALSGEEDKPEVNPLHLAFAQNPAGLLAEAALVGSEKAIAAIDARAAEQRQIESAAKPILDQYPELHNYLEFADGLMKRELADNKPIDQAVKIALEKTAKKLNLKSLSEEERQRQVMHAGVPPVGGPNMRTPEQKKSGAMDYIKALRHNAKAVRGELPASK